MPKPTERRRAAIVLATRTALSAAPPGIDAHAFASCCLADCLEILDDLVGVRAGVAGNRSAAEPMLGAIALPDATTIHAVAEQLSPDFDEVVTVPADVPDLPALVVAKAFRALQRNDVVIAPDRHGAGCVAVGVRLPWPTWLPVDLDLDEDPTPRLQPLAPRGRRPARAPDWHRLRRPADIERLDPRLEGWEQTRALLSGRAFELPDG